MSKSKDKWNAAHYKRITIYLRHDIYDDYVSYCQAVDSPLSRIPRFAVESTVHAFRLEEENK